VQSLRFTGAALIDQNDVAVAADTGKGRCGAGVKVAGSHAGSARQHKHRVGRALAVDGSNARHKQTQSPSAGVAVVLGHHQVAAFTADR
jgi:hypothetical protein